jgi:hypothetical protein
MSVDMTRLDALRGLLDRAKKEDAMNASAWMAGPDERRIDVDHVDPHCEECGETEGSCLCEPDLLGEVERLTRIVRDLSAEVESLKQGDREAADLAQKVIQAVTLEEAKSAARIYLGLQEPF